MITSSGAICDVCGKYILPLAEDERVNTFTVGGISQELCCHNACKVKLANCGNDWEKLPIGPLRDAFEHAIESEPEPEIDEPLRLDRDRQLVEEARERDRS